MPSYVQLALNGVQVASMIVFSLLMAIKMVYGICKEETVQKNKVGNVYMGENNISEMYMDLKKENEVDFSHDFSRSGEK